MRNHIRGQLKQMPKIELITFDLDDTFWDIKTVIIAAEKNYRQWLEAKVGVNSGLKILNGLALTFVYLNLRRTDI